MNTKKKSRSDCELEKSRLIWSKEQKLGKEVKDVL